MTEAPALVLLARARQARLRNAEAARQAELRARAARTPQVRHDWTEIAAEYRDLAAGWAATVEELEADHGLTRRQCADPACDKRALDGRPWCAEHAD